MDILSSANQIAKQQGFSPQDRFTLFTASESGQPVGCHNGLTLSPDRRLDSAESADFIFLPGLWRNPQRVVAKSASLLLWLQQRYQQGSIIAAVGTGCCLLAAAGLLDGKPATTHWYYFDRFQTSYPKVVLKRQHFITQSGNLFCAASVNSLADLTIHFIQLIFNRSIADTLQRHFSHEIRQDYEATSYLESNNTNHPDEQILQIQLWLQTVMGKPLTASEIAEQFGMSSRNCARRFKAAIGKTPIEYLQDLRMQTAKDLLKGSNLTIGEVAYRVGFQDLSYFARMFKKNVSVTPKDYRTTVRAKLFSSPSEQ